MPKRVETPVERFDALLGQPLQELAFWADQYPCRSGIFRPDQVKIGTQ